MDYWIGSGGEQKEYAYLVPLGLFESHPIKKDPRL
jgi:hypothetical protein